MRTSARNASIQSQTPGLGLRFRAEQKNFCLHVCDGRLIHVLPGNRRHYNNLKLRSIVFGSDR